MSLEPLVLVSCVHFNDTPRVTAYLSHLAGEVELPDGWNLAVAVCDNSGGFAADSRNNVTIFRPGQNLGFLNGALYAYRTWRSSTDISPTWVVISGTDIVFEPDFFRVLAGLELSSDIGVLAPDVVNQQNMPENPYLRDKPSRSQLALHVVATSSIAVAATYYALHRIRQLVRPHFGRGHPLGDLNAMTDIYAPHGSLMVLHERLLRLAPEMQFPGLLYGEEEFIARQASKANLRVVFTPQLKAHHTRVGALATSTTFKDRLAWRRAAAKRNWAERDR